MTNDELSKRIHRNPHIVSWSCQGHVVALSAYHVYRSSEVGDYHVWHKVTYVRGFGASLSKYEADFPDYLSASLCLDQWVESAIQVTTGRVN